MTDGKVSRRQFLIGGALASLTGVVGYGAGIETLELAHTRFELASPKWPKDYPALKMAVITDLHVGCPSVDLSRVAAIVETVNASRPDVIVLLGDYLIRYVVGGRYVAPPTIGEALSKLSAPLGVFSVLGNHDWWKDGPGMWRALEKGGIKVLENDAVAVNHQGKKIWIGGLADDSTRTPDIPKMLAKANDESAPVIVLSHDPAPFMEMTDRPVVTLAGHTHGGQVAIPFIGPLMIPGRAPLRFAAGHIHENGRDLIVSKGIGTSGIPVRFDRVPEILTVTVSAAPKTVS